MPPLTTPSYTNEVTPELLHHLDKPAFTKALLASFSAETRALVGQQQVYRAAHPAIGIYRAATEGSRTRNGGMVEKTASPRSYDTRQDLELFVARKGVPEADDFLPGVED
ncbi:hypothetical protein [Pseudomonas abietaniphila]|jgi:hypothetical protein